VSHYFFIPALLIIAAAALWAILDDKYADNLVQRIGLALSCFGSSIYAFLASFGLTDTKEPRLLLLYGVAMFAIGTFYKVWRINTTKN
jgi:hypothetical protein